MDTRLREAILVHCRVGSLENFAIRGEPSILVHCRVGSLENRE